MKRLPASLLLCLALCACDAARDNRIATYANRPNKITVNIDEASITVLQDGYGEYVAWGGPALKEKSYPAYRQQRAIEVASGCRIDKVMSKKPGEVLRARVDC